MPGATDTTLAISSYRGAIDLCVGACPCRRTGIHFAGTRAAGGGKFCGLIYLFSTRNGEPLAIMPDGVIQRLRVACCNALAAKYMAPAKAATYALLGSGWQASGQALAMATVRPIREIRVYSP